MKDQSPLIKKSAKINIRLMEETAKRMALLDTRELFVFHAGYPSEMRDVYYDVNGLYQEGFPGRPYSKFRREL